MIQRIQTVYLLLITALSVAGLCTSQGYFWQNGGGLVDMYNLWLVQEGGAHDYTPWALFALLLLVAVLSFGAVFLFRRRMLQVRLILFSGLLLVGYYIAFGAFVYVLGGKMDSHFTVRWTAALPAVALILDYLAFRAVMRDEMIVRSLDRLR